MVIKHIVLLRGEHITNLYEYIHNPSYRLYWDESKGYSYEFAVKHDEILQNIIENPDLEVKIVGGLDDICNFASCPNKKDECQSKKLLEKDKDIATKFGLRLNKKYKTDKLLKIINKNVNKRRKI